MATCLAVVGLASSAQAVTFEDPTFSFETVLTLTPFQPVGVTWSATGQMFIWQKNGIVRVYQSGALLPTPFLDISAQVNTYGDRGLLGFALDPDFQSNRYAYLLYVHETGGNPNAASARSSRLSRVTANPTNPNVVLAGSEVVLLDDLPASDETHAIGMIRFAPDGTLFISNGDGANPIFVDSLALGAQELFSARGKIFRINPDGSVPSPPKVTNPFDDGTDSIRSRVWAYGVRNTFRFDIHPTTGLMYGSDVGWNTYEEINRILPGRNFGWPCWEGPFVQPDYQAAFPTECAAATPSAVTGPAYYYDHTFGSAPVGSTFYTGTVYPVGYQNNYFFGDYTGGWIRRLAFAADGSISQNVQFASGIANPIVHLATGPDGLIYAVDYVAGVILRIRYAGPIAAAAGNPVAGYTPLNVAFSSAGSVNPLGGSLTYLWDFGDNTTSTLPNPSHTYVTGGVQTYQSTLTVTNAASQSAKATVPVTVGSLPPNVTIDSPLVGATALPGQTLFYGGSAFDPDDRNLPPSALKWDILLRHNTHVHGLLGSVGTGGSFQVENHGTGATFGYEIYLTARDSSGLETRKMVFVSVLQDVIPPSAPATPAASTESISTIELNWGPATDNGGVALYHVERCQGLGCSNFVEVGTTDARVFFDHGLLAGTTYVYRVRTEDASGNLGSYSVTSNASTGTTGPLGLVAAYSFDEGHGTALLDASGRANNGVITGATWVGGRFGSALFFENRPTDLVEVPDSDSLDVTTGMTLEAWVQPTAVLQSFHAIASKIGERYGLNASTNSVFPEGFATIGGSCCAVAHGTAALVENRWTHLAVTYNGSALRLYVDGVQVASTPATGLLGTSTLPLRIGANAPGGETFIGFIDELRIYNRALSAAEIQGDMALPVQPPLAPAVPGTTPAATVILIAWLLTVAGYGLSRDRTTIT